MHAGIWLICSSINRGSRLTAVNFATLIAMLKWAVKVPFKYMVSGTFLPGFDLEMLLEQARLVGGMPLDYGRILRETINARKSYKLNQGNPRRAEMNQKNAEEPQGDEDADYLECVRRHKQESI